MEVSPEALLRVGDWCVNPTSGQILRAGETAQLDVRALRLLLCLAERAGEVVSIDDLLQQVWSGVVVSPDSVYQAVAFLRRQLGDDPKKPAYIATVPRLGYRMVAAVSAWEEQTATAPLSAPSPKHPLLGSGVVWAGIAVLVVAAAFVMYAVRRNQAASPARNLQAEKSIAVLPFLDLTDKMSHEIFADGMTEEVIDKLSKIPGFRIPAPRTSFQLKGKKMSIADVGKTLGVTYVVDGSIRKSGSTMRVAVRLVRADKGYVIWSETYERPWGDLLKVQNEIAAEVTAAIRVRIEGRSSIVRPIEIAARLAPITSPEGMLERLRALRESGVMAAPGPRTLPQQRRRARPPSRAWTSKVGELPIAGLRIAPSDVAHYGQFGPWLISANAFLSRSPECSPQTVGKVLDHNFTVSV